MIKKILAIVALCLGSLNGQPLTNYGGLQWDTGATTPAYCTPPGFFYNTTASTYHVCVGHAFNQVGLVNVTGPERTLFTQTSQVTIANTVSELTLIGTGVGTVILPANFFTKGTTLKLNMYGYHSTTNVPSFPTLVINVKLNGTTILTTGTVQTGASTNQGWDTEVQITGITTGTTGTIQAEGVYREWDPTRVSLWAMINTGTTAIDTTIAQTLNITLQFSAADPANTGTSAIFFMRQF